jgi:hypothetical protein
MGKSIDHRIREDKRLLLFFSIWLSIDVVFALIVGLFVGMTRLDVIFTVLMIFIIGAFFLTGILAFKYYHKRGLISTKKVFKWFVMISAVSAPIFAIIFIWEVMANPYASTVFFDSGEVLSFVIGIHFGMFIGVFLTLILFFFIGFGMIGVMSGLIRSKTPDMLVEITKITPNITEAAKAKDIKKYAGYIWLGWVFGIPEVLDTRTLTINRGEPRAKIPWPVFKNAMLWQVLFGMVLIIYISFSPFLLDFVEMQELFSLASIMTVFIPLFILPWFIYLRLDAKIKGPVKPFRLFDGLSSRMFQTLVAFGTIFLLVRIALRNPAIISVMFSFIIYSMFFVVGVVIFTFVYFNYFENDLAKDIVKRYEEFRD